MWGEKVQMFLVTRGKKKHFSRKIDFCLYFIPVFLTQKATPRYLWRKLSMFL